jgi:outer membrane protein OmpA-like peptidoglycan-associated protein
MADYATKRVPLEPDGGEFRDSHAASGDDSLEELRHLIIAPEQEDLARLQERVENQELRTQDVSQVLPEAMQLRRRQGGEQALGEALAPSVESALRESVRKDPGTLADALFPVMGPAIRRSILQTLRTLFDSFNQTMEQSLSLRGLKWRLEALRTGKRFSEVVLLHSLVYRVEQIFLIHKKTGLPLAHAVAPAAAMQDPSLVSGMLTAIQDFVRDSFNARPGESIEKLNVGELEVWVEQGPYASIAAVIRGMAPPELRLRMAETLELLHRQYGTQMQQFAGDNSAFEPAVDLLTNHLDSQLREKAAAKPRPYVWAFTSVLALVLVAWLSVRWWQDRQWEQFVSTLRQQPGIVITSAGRHDGRFLIQGLRDPLAADPKELLRQAGLDAGKAEFRWNGYYALDGAIVARRAAALLNSPPTARLSVHDGLLRAEGEARGAWIASLREQGSRIPGVLAVDTSNLKDADEIDFRRLKGTIEATVLRFGVGSAEISPPSFAQLADLKAKIDALRQSAANLHREVSLSIIGHSDNTGLEATNRPLSQSRADRVAALLKNQGVTAARVTTKGVASTEPLRTEDNEEARQYNRSVTFRISTPSVPGS